jgi:hypothetical protein
VNTIEMVKALITALQSGDMELAAQCMSEDCIISGFTPNPLERDEFLALQSELLAAMPDFSYNLGELRAQDDEVTGLVAITGTHSKDLELPMYGLRTIPATGLAVVLPQVESTWDVERDRVVRVQIEQVPGGGLTGLLQQVGAELPLFPRVGEVDRQNLAP